MKALNVLDVLLNHVDAFVRSRRYRAARVALLRPLAPRGPRRLVVLVAGVLTIVMWQLAFSGPRARIDGNFKITAASGVHQDRAFTYFLYYLDLFPVASSAKTNCTSDTETGCWDSSGTPGDYSYAAAQDVLTKQGKTLQQDLGWTWYAGDRGKIYLYLFDAWLKGAPWNPSPRPASRLAFTFALSALFASMWWVRRPLLGGYLAAFLGSNPFQLYEVHVDDNVFGWNITIAILLLAIHVPLLRRWYRPHPTWVFLWPIGVGVLMATLRTIRSEPTPLLVAPVVTYLILRGLSRKRRAAMVAVLAAAFVVTGSVWSWHFVRAHRHAGEVIASHGGHPFNEEIRLYHHVWHPIWCGLGDFGGQYGYEWNDHAAAKYAKPLLEAKGIYVPSAYMRATPTDPREYFDPETKIYRKLPYELPYYNEIVRDKVLSDIRQHPLWYGGILAKRVRRVFTMTTPIRLSSAGGWIAFPWHAALALPLVIVLALARSRLLLGLVLFTIPSVATAVLIYSDKGTTYYGVFHIIAFAIFTSGAASHLVHWTAPLLQRTRARVARHG
jgi:hypothetical protein